MAPFDSPFAAPVKPLVFSAKYNNPPSLTGADPQRRSGKEMDEGELKTIIASEQHLALGADGGKLSHDRRILLEQYEGLPVGLDNIEGRSQVVSRNVLEAIEWVLPALLRVFTSSDNLFEFEPYRAGEELVANQATAYCNYIISKDNPGFMILHDWFKTALIQRVGYIQVYWLEERISSTNSYTGLSDQEYQALTNTDDVEVIEHKPYPNPDPMAQWFTEDDPEPQQPQLHDCVLKVWQTEGRVKIESVAPEEILVSRRAPSTVLDGKHFVCRKVLRRVSDLREMGFDEELIEQAMGFNDPEFNSERIARFELDDDWPMVGDRTDPAMREIYLEYNFIPVDFDGDGVAELRQVVTAGNGQIVFSNSEIDEIPILALCPIPQPHKHIGFGIADLVSDLQTIKSVLLRQILDNLYLTNSPRVIVDEMAATDSTYDDLLTVRPGGIVRVANIQGIQPMDVPFVAGQSMPMLEYLDQTQEIRTGVARQNQTFAVDDLNKYASGTAINAAQQAASQRVEMIARIFAETGIKQLARRILGLITRHQQHERIIRLTGHWVPFDPRMWRQSMDVSVNVGLGSGNKDQILGHLMQILQVQQQIVMVQKGVSGPLVTADNIYSTLSKLTENAGFKQAFFTDPRTAQQQPGQGQQQPPDPEMMKAQQEMQANAAKAQSEMQLAKEKAALSAQLAQQQHAADMQRDQAKFEAEMQREQIREQFKMDLEARKFQHQAAIQTAEAAAKASLPLNGAF